MKTQFQISAEGRVRHETSDVRDVADLVNKIACEYLGEDRYPMPDFAQMQVGDYVGVEFEEDETFSISVELVEIELSIVQQIAEKLQEAHIAHTVASTGSVYVKTPRSEEYNQIRIADHDANGAHGNFEVDLAKVSDVAELVAAIENASFWGDFYNLEDFKL